jgi:hypothetical protein
MQVDVSKKEQPGLALQRAVGEYVRAVRTAPGDTLPSLPDSVVNTLREVIAFDFGGKASAFTRRSVVVTEWLTRLDLALAAVAINEDTVARIARHVQEELREKLPTTN